MAKKWLKFFLGASHMINNDIFNIFNFSTFSLGYFQDPVFRAIFDKISQNAGFVRYPREKVEKLKMLKMLKFIICEAPQKISIIFCPFLAIFTLFHSKNWPYLQKSEFGNLAKTRFWFLLVNNSLCSIPLSWTRSYIKETPGDRCVKYCQCQPITAKYIEAVGQSQLWTHLDVAVPEADGGDVSAVRVSALYTRDARVQLRGEVTHARLPGAVPQPHNLNTAVRIII